MREILFRGKRIDNGEWVKGMPCSDLKGGVDSIQSNIGGGIFDVIPETVGQYTGLKDKNGKQIFEGDICCNAKTGEIIFVQWHGTMAAYVWSKRREGNNYLYEWGELFRAFDKYEVIGNIHDNPELEVDA